MSKFGIIMDSLDLKNHRIEERKFPQGIHPFDPQEICRIPVKLPEINPTCAKCVYCGLSIMTGQVNELGISGYMSNQRNGLKSVTRKPPVIDFRKPDTMIVAEGKVYVCRNRKQGENGVYILTKENVPCDQFKEKESLKER